MSGILSIAREVLGFWNPQRFPESRLLSASLLSACVISFGMAWWIENNDKRKIISEKKQLEEELADRYPRLKGEITLGYLDTGKRYEKNRVIVSEGCSLAAFYLRVVNHSAQDACAVPPPTLKLTINGREYPGESVVAQSNTIKVVDPDLKGSGPINDLLLSYAVGEGRGVFQKPRLHLGWLVFNLPDSQVHLDGNERISGTATITIKDTLGGIHPFNPETATMQFRLNRIEISQ
jgi:hypothetical protein